MTKVVIIDTEDTICSVIIGPTGPEHRHQANEVMREALDNMQLPFERIEYCIATGYGRINVPFADRQITELTCHARGVAHSFPGVRTAIDIGGQDAKGLKIKDGKLLDFVMNDKCAAGTGRFLEVLSEKLGIAVEDLGSMSMKSQQKVTISSTCTIFAEQEMISYLSEGTSVEDIIAGLHDAIASRVVRMVKRLKIEPDVVLTGGVAKNIGVVHAVQEIVGLDIHVPDNPLISGALGAALLGREAFLQAQERNETLERKKRQLEDTVTFYT